MIEFPHLMMALSALISLAGLVATIIMTRGKVAGDRVAAVEADVAVLKGKVVAIESDLRHTPSSAQMTAMELTLREMTGQLNVMQERLKPIAATTERLQEFLIDEARERRGAA